MAEELNVTPTGAEVVVSLVLTVGGWQANIVGAQVNFNAQQGGNTGTGTVHIEANGHSGVVTPPWASPADLARLASGHLHDLVGAIPDSVFAPIPQMARAAAKRLAEQIPAE